MMKFIVIFALVGVAYGTPFLGLESIVDEGARFANHTIGGAGGIEAEFEAKGILPDFRAIIVDTVTDMFRTRFYETMEEVAPGKRLGERILNLFDIAIRSKFCLQLAATFFRHVLEDLPRLMPTIKFVFRLAVSDFKELEESRDQFLSDLTVYGEDYMKERGLHYY